MNTNYINFSTKYLIIMLVCAMSIFLASCTSTTSGNLGGVAGAGNGNNNSIPTIQPAGNVEPQAEPPSPTPIPAPTGHIIYVSDRDGQNRLYIMNADGTSQSPLTDNAETPSLSLDGTHVAFVSTIDNNKDVFVYNLNTGALTRVTTDLAADRAPALSSDGSRIAFESFRDGNWEIYSANIDGSGLINLTNDLSGDSSPVWSPDNSAIAFTSNRFGNTDIFVVSPNGGSPSTLTTNPVPDAVPSWSPDGSKVVYLSYANSETANICHITRDGLNSACIVQSFGRSHSPVWLNNDQIAFFWQRGDNQFGIDTLVLSTSLLTTISSQFTPRGEPVISPDGLRIAYQAEVDGNMEIVQYIISTNETIRLTNITSFDGQPVWTSR